jgi:hypothetical protein
MDASFVVLYSAGPMMTCVEIPAADGVARRGAADEVMAFL